MKIFTVLLALKSLLCPCHKDKKVSDFEAMRDKYKIRKTGKLPEVINESSGLVASGNGNTFWTHNDGGGKPELYEIDVRGNILGKRSLPDISNDDWEDISRDEEGNIYIGNFGNNLNTRKDLRIYKVDTNNKVEVIAFDYPEQRDFPPAAEERNFDCEAFFFYNDSLYLFMKHRGNKCVRFYKLPSHGGVFKAELVKEQYLSGMITGAALSPDKKSFALLSYGKIYFFRLEGIQRFTAIPHGCRRFSRSGQSEAITFMNETDFLITNEGGKIFIMRKKKRYLYK